ncbi:DUF1918 domain-containing protein [Marinitenerispora sediminis]|uniref:DUF1918 domain-containing protein n=1 Tax=Marinitenerispora sediminis TaxID=1931232 RepID=A0A368T720_9ACTN|nr:DUF1918 domain-containing protein [Marinitenerispora sediminis]RCV59790.1 DUF1918 domain-containing protein [Marinitenerispora sediminis]
MRARVGDLLVVETTRAETRRRTAVVIEATGDGAPPYRVRWSDDGHEALVYPGADAHVETRRDRAAAT